MRQEMSQTSTVFTYDDYLTLPSDGKRYEILGGELQMTPAPGTDHQRVSARLYTILNGYIREQKLGEVLYAPVDVVLSMTDVVEPDLVFVSTDRLQIIAR